LVGWIVTNLDREMQGALYRRVNPSVCQTQSSTP
jgi:hypothetical protein